MENPLMKRIREYNAIRKKEDAAKAGGFSLGAVLQPRTKNREASPKLEKRLDDISDYVMKNVVGVKTEAHTSFGLSIYRTFYSSQSDGYFFEVEKDERIFKYGSSNRHSSRHSELLLRVYHGGRMLFMSSKDHGGAEGGDDTLGVEARPWQVLFGTEHDDEVLLLIRCGITVRDVRESR